MRIVIHIFVCVLALATIIAVTVTLKPAALRYALALDEITGAAAPTYIHAGVPFVVRDHYATQICISSRSGHPMLPFVMPTEYNGAGAYTSTLPHVQAWVPFTMHDRNGTQICISTHGGEAIGPFVMP